MRYPRLSSKFLPLIALLFLPALALGQASDVYYTGSVNSACTNATTNCGNAVISQTGPGYPLQSNGAVEVATKGFVIASITVRGTYSGASINFEFSDDGQVTYFSNICTRTDANIQESSEALPANQVRAWDCGIGGSQSFRMRLAAVTSGTLQVGITLSQASIEPAPSVAIVSQAGSSFCGGTLQGNSCTFSPTQLGVNAITLPASASTANTNIIDTRGVKQLTLDYNCTQSVNVNLNGFAEDGVTQKLGVQIVAGAVAGNVQAYLSSEQIPVASSGTISTQVKFPQRAVSFNWVNTTAVAGTCTARLFLAY